LKTYTHLTDEEFVREVDHVASKDADWRQPDTVAIPSELMLEIIKRLRGTDREEEINELRVSEAALEQTIEDLEEKVYDLKEDLKKCQ